MLVLYNNSFWAGRLDPGNRGSRGADGVDVAEDDYTIGIDAEDAM